MTQPETYESDNVLCAPQLRVLTDPEQQKIDELLNAIPDVTPHDRLCIKLLAKVTTFTSNSHLNTPRLLLNDILYNLLGLPQNTTLTQRHADALTNAVLNAIPGEPISDIPPTDEVIEAIAQVTLIGYTIGRGVQHLIEKYHPDTPPFFPTSTSSGHPTP